MTVILACLIIADDSTTPVQIEVVNIADMSAANIARIRAVCGGQSGVIGKIRVTTDRLAVRTDPGVQYPECFRLRLGSEHDVYELRELDPLNKWARIGGGWCAVRYAGAYKAIYLETPK